MYLPVPTVQFWALPIGKSQIFFPKKMYVYAFDHPSMYLSSWICTSSHLDTVTIFSSCCRRKTLSMRTLRQVFHAAGPSRPTQRNQPPNRTVVRGLAAAAAAASLPALREDLHAWAQPAHACPPVPPGQRVRLRPMLRRVSEAPSAAPPCGAAPF